MPVIGETLTASAAARPLFAGLFPAYATRKRFDAPMFVMYLALHLSLLAAPFTFTWQALAVAVVLSFSTMCLGITLCYHRLLAHRSFKIPRPASVILPCWGACRCSGVPCGGRPAIGCTIARWTSPTTRTRPRSVFCGRT